MRSVVMKLCVGEKVASVNIGPFKDNAYYSAEKYANDLKGSCEDMLGERGVNVEISISNEALSAKDYLKPALYMDFLSVFIRECVKAGTVSPI